MRLFKRRAAEMTSTINAYRRLFSTDDGKAVLKDLMAVAHFNRSVVGKDVNETYYNEGMRNLVLRIIETAKMSHNEVETLRENLLRQSKDLHGEDE